MKKIIGQILCVDLADIMSAHEHDEEVYLMIRVDGKTTLEEIAKAENMLVIDTSIEPEEVPAEVPDCVEEYPFMEEEPYPVPVTQQTGGGDDDIRSFVAANFGSEGEKELEEEKKAVRRGRPRKEN